jgi:hypothetical protein
MPNEEKMSIDEHREDLELVKMRHVEGNKVERGSLLDEMEAVTAVERLVVSKPWGAPQPTQPRPQRALGGIGGWRMSRHQTASLSR